MHYWWSYFNVSFVDLYINYNLNISEIIKIVSRASAIIVLALEVPICFSFVEFLRPITAFSENRPHWQKTAIYMA